MSDQNEQKAARLYSEDEKDRTKHLFKFFCQNLHLGHWELAHACIQDLTRTDCGVISVLKDVALYPYDQSHGSPFIQDPHQLSWLCLQAYGKFGDEKTEETESIEMDVHFRLLLVEACASASADIVKELYLFHRRLHMKTPRQFDYVVPKLSDDCLAFLKNLMLEKPSLGHAILRALSVIKELVFFQHNQELQLIYIDCLQRLLHELCRDSPGAIVCRDDCSYCKSDSPVLQCENLVEKFYHILSLYDPHESSDDEPYQNLFRKILDVVYFRTHLLQLDMIYSCLLGRTSMCLLEVFSQLDHDRRFLDTSSNGAKTFLQFSSDEDRLKSWKDIYLFCIKQKQHFFESLMQNAIDLIQVGEFDQLQTLLKPEEFQVLKPLVLLLGWNHCYSCSNANKLLNALWGQNDSIRHDPVVEQACKKLLYQVDLVQWCLEKAKPLLIASGADMTHHDRATEMFQGLEAHSVLYVLHQSTQLATLDMDEVLEILHKRPVLMDECPSNDKSKAKTVRFAEKSDGLVEPAKVSISIEQERDIAIYRSYCALKHFMDAMYFCADSSNFMQRKPTINNQSADLESNNQDQTGQGHSFQHIYDMFVTSKLKAGKEHISKLHPLSYRVETLENTFSLLFMTQEDIQEAVMIQTDSGEDMPEDPNCSLDCTDSALQSFDSAVQSLESTFEQIYENELELDNEEKFTMISNKLWRISKIKSESDLDASANNDSSSVEAGNVAYDEPYQTTSDSPKAHLKFKKERSVSTPGRKSSAEGKSETKNHVEDASNFSNGSTSSSYKIGFIANQYIVRDFLAMLNECLLELDGAMYRLIGEKVDRKDSLGTSSSIQKALNLHMKCTVGEENLQSRISRLRQYVSEAQWRFQLVSHDQVPSEPGKILSTPIRDDAADNSDEDLDIGLFQDDPVTPVDKSTSNRRRGGSLEKVFPHRGSVSGRESESQATTDAGGSGANSPGGSQHRRKRCVSVRRESSSSSVISKTRDGIIPCMLGSHQSLLSMCLRRGHFAQANQIVKLFKLEDTSEAQEMAFAEQYQSASRRLQAIDPRRRGSMPVAAGRAPSNRFSMNAIKSVAAAGEASMMITNIVDEILSSSTLPLYPENIKADSIGHKAALLGHLDPENIPTMVVLDLACTACRTWEGSENLLTMGHKRLCGDGTTNRPRSSSGLETMSMRHSQSPDVDSKKSGASSKDMMRKHDIGLKGVEPFLNQLWTLMSREGVVVSDDLWSGILRNSVTQILTNASLPLDIAGFRDYVATLIEMERAVTKVERAFVEVKAMEQKSFISKSQEKKKMPRPIIHITMKRLLQVFEKVITGKGVLVHFERNVDSMIEPTKNYLQNLYDHVKSFCHLIMENEPKQKDAPPQTLNYYMILDDSPTNILGKLMFEKKISPYKLESFAQRLSLDLLHIIVNSCCPRIPSKQMISCREELTTVKPFEHGRLVLNASSGLKKSTRCPDVVAREIITRIIKILKESACENTTSNYVNHHTVTEIMKEKDLVTIFDGVEELAVVDLSKLSTPHMRKSFYANVTNLLTIQSLFYQIHVKRVSMHTLTPLQRLNALCTFSYRIGQLGPVSLLELRFLIGRNGLPPPNCFDKLLVKRLYGLDSKDPWAKFGPPPEPRLLFLLIDGTYSSPPLQVVSSELVSQQVEMAMESYLEDAVKVHEEDRKMSLPEMLLWYRLDFVGQKGDSYLAEYEGLVNFVAEHSPSTLSGPLRNLLNLDGIHGFGENIDKTGKKELPFKVTIDSYNWDFAIRFDYTPIRLHQKLTHRRGSSLPIDLEGCKSEYLASTNTPTASKLYNLRAVTLDYMKARCTLVATLISLICSDEIDDIEDNFDDVYFDSSSLEKSSGTPPTTPRKRAGSDISLVDVRSYRYQKLSQNFPILCNHVQENIIPLAGALQQDIANHGDPILKLLSMSIRKDIRECMLMMSSSSQFWADVNNILNELIKNKKWLIITQVIANLPEYTLTQNPEWMTLRDFSLCCCTRVEATTTNSPQRVTTNWRFLQQISDPCTQVRAVLGTLQMWPVAVCLDLLKMCQMLQDIEPGLKKAVSSQLETMKLYQKIIECAKTLQVKLSMLSKTQVTTHDEYEAIAFENLEQLMTWQSVVKQSKQMPEEILKVLVKCQDFKTLRRWAEIHSVGPIMKQSIEESYVVNLLEDVKPKPMDAYIALEEISKSDGKLCCKICDNLLGRLQNQENILFVARFMLQHLSEELGAERRNDLYLICMGAKILLYLPESSRVDYVHLRSSPMLIFEQLLMNMKVDWAGQCIDIIKKDLNAIPHKVSGCALDALDQMITEYSKHALEFPVSQVVPTSTTSNSSPATTTGRMSASPVRSLMSEEDRDKVAALGEPLKAATIPAALANRRGSRQFLSTNMVRPSSSASGLKESPLTRHLNLNAGGSFVMPVEPPMKDKWVPDGAVSECMVCQLERFSMFNRRHHCRRCGRVVCASCSSKTTMIRGQSARTCDDCYEQMFKPRGSFNEHDFYQQRVIERLSGASPSGSYQATPPMAGSIDNSTLQILVQCPDYFWKLVMDEEVNAMTREDFYYEQSPSTSLCISILDLHSDPKVCGETMLQLCDELSKLLKPIAPGVANPEVDYNFVISMMKYLLINAKLKFLKCNEPQGEGLCEIYQSKVDLLNLLVSNNCKDILSVQELTKSDTVRRLRDRLIEDERLSLAMEVSTKCGIDPSGVWAAWGIGCLQSGNYQEAREKFRRCLKVPVDRNQSLASSKLLTDIVVCVEKLPSTGAGGVKCLLAQLSLANTLTAEPLKQYTDDSTMDELQFKECLFYLKTYGTHMAIIGFFRRHGFWQKAVKYVLDKKCSADIFVEGLLVPAIQNGDLGKLQDQLVMIDSSLALWNTYLTACCRYLNRMKYYNMLYQFQLFMKDFIRAAMTCITTFFGKGAITQTELRGRLQYLLNAKQHLEMYLTQTKYSASGANRSVPDWGKHGASAIRLTQSPAEVQKHLHTIDLQIEVTQYLRQCQMEGATDKPHEYPPGHVPTLFGDNKKKGEVAMTVLLSGGKLSDAFAIAIRIIQDYRLGATVIFSQVGRQLAKQQKYGMIRQLLGKINEISICDDASYDEVIGACVRVIADDTNEGKEAESLIKLTKLDTNKINAYMLCGKLKSAYLIAVRRNSEEDIQRIAGAAQRAGQSAMFDICQKWLRQRQGKR